MSVIELKINEETIQLDELLFDGTESAFENFSFIQQNHLPTLPNDSTIIFVGSSRSLRKIDQFKTTKVYIYYRST